MNQSDSLIRKAKNDFVFSNNSSCSYRVNVRLFQIQRFSNFYCRTRNTLFPLKVFFNNFYIDPWCNFLKEFCSEH